MVAVLAEELRQGDGAGDFSPETFFAPIGDDAGGVGAEAGEERLAAGIADGVLAIGAVESHPLASEAVEIGGVDLGCAVGAEVGAEIVDHDEDNVEALLIDGSGAGVMGKDGECGSGGGGPNESSTCQHGRYATFSNAHYS